MKRKSLPTGRDFLFVEGYGNENPGAFQPTRPLRGATTGLVHRLSAFDISTHAPLAGRDLYEFIDTERDKISTHAPLAGRDFAVLTFVLMWLYFNPRAPCGARHR